ncbi:MAG: hypothetical protein V1754_13530, partial [Pseudomonadota bacterium]
IHEFGHAMARVRLGSRFELLSVAPSGNMAGYVKSKQDPGTAKSLVANIYAKVASRAMERIFFSKTPTKPESLLDIGSGSSMDIRQATDALFKMLYELGLNPYGGSGVYVGKPMDPPLHQANATASNVIDRKVVEALSRVLRDMEDHLVNELLSAHPRKWYVEKIKTISREGILNEATFYKLIGYKYPGENEFPLGEGSLVDRDFGSVVKREPASVRAARAFKQGKTLTTAAQNLETAMEIFKAALKKYMPYEMQTEAQQQTNSGTTATSSTF